MGAGVFSEYAELLGSIMEEPNMQIVALAAVLSAVAYRLSFKASEQYSPKLCAAYGRLKRIEQLNWDSLVPSTLHAVVVSALCIWALCYSGDFFDTPPAAAAGAGAGAPPPSAVPLVLRATPSSYAIIGASGGYFLMDAALLAAQPGMSSPQMALHHGLALLSLGVAAQAGLMHVYLLMVLLSEVTTPLVNLRWWLDKAGLKHLPLYTVNGLLLLLVWGVARVMLFAAFYVHVATHWSLVSTAPLHALVVLLGVPVLLGGMNLLWFVKIVRGAYKLVVKPKQQQQQGQQQQKEQQQHHQEHHEQEEPCGQRAAAAAAAAGAAAQRRRQQVGGQQAAAKLGGGGGPHGDTPVVAVRAFADGRAGAAAAAAVAVGGGGGRHAE